MSQLRKIGRRDFIKYGAAGAVIAGAATIAGYHYASQISKPTERMEFVKVGVILPLSGPLAKEGELVLRGHLLAAERLNAKGGFKSLGGSKVAVVKADGYDAKVTATETERLITTERVAALTGCYASDLSLAATEVAERYEVPFVVDASISEKITERGFKYTFRTCGKASTYARTSVEFAIAVMKPKSVAIIVEDTEYGLSMAEQLRSLLGKYGLTTLVDETYPYNAADVSPTMLKLKAANPDVIFAASYLDDAILITKAIHASNLDVRGFIGLGGGWTTLEYIEGTGELSEYFFSTTMWNYDAQRPGVIEAVEMYKEKYEELPMQHFALGYDASTVLYAAIERAASTDPKRIREALTETDVETLQTRIRFDEKGQGSDKCLVVQVINGKYVTVWPEEVAAAKPVYPVPTLKEKIS